MTERLTPYQELPFAEVLLETACIAHLGDIDGFRLTYKYDPMARSINSVTATKLNRVVPVEASPIILNATYLDSISPILPKTENIPNLLKSLQVKKLTESQEYCLVLNGQIFILPIPEKGVGLYSKDAVLRYLSELKRRQIAPLEEESSNRLLLDVLSRLQHFIEIKSSENSPTFDQVQTQLDLLKLACTGIPDNIKAQLESIHQQMKQASETRRDTKKSFFSKLTSKGPNIDDLAAEENQLISSLL